MHPILLLVCLVQHPFGTLEFGGELSAVQSAMDVTYLDLSLTIDPERHWLEGWAELEILLDDPSVDRVELDLLDAFSISAVTLDGRETRYERAGHKLFIPLPRDRGDRVRTHIAYQGHPLEAKRPPWEGGFNWSTTESGQPWVGLSCQGEGGKVWYPSKDHPSDKIDRARLRITLPEPLYCAANGLLQSIEAAREGWRTFDWRTDYPISVYNLTVNIADYAILERTYTGENGDMPVLLYVLKESQAADRQDGDPRDYQQKQADLLDMTLDYLAFYAKHFGEYPFIGEKFALAHTDYLGMEHQTINSYGNHFRVEDGYDWLLLHEMGHEWWGNKVSVTDWRDFWIHEGICTYATGMYLEEKQGFAAALAFFQDLAGEVTHRRPLAGKEPATASQAYQADVYNKGALVLHALRFLLGKRLVERILEAFANDPRHTYLKTVTSADFIAQANQIAGEPLEWFFNPYLYESEPPLLFARREGESLHLRWQSASFTMPVEVRIGGEGGSRYRRIAMVGGEGSLDLPAGVAVDLDPREWVMKRVKWGEAAESTSTPGD